MYNVISSALLLAIMFFLYNRYKREPFVKFEETFRSTLKQDIIDLMTQFSYGSSEAINKIRESIDLAKTVEKLREELANLKINESQIKEKYAREKREIEHMLGLEKTRQAQELELSKREAALEVKEQALKQEREMFKKEAESIQKRFEDQLKDQNMLITNLLGALPNMKIIRTENGASK